LDKSNGGRPAIGGVRERAAVLAGGKVKGRIMFGILITSRATGLARTSRGDLEVKTKASPDQMAATSLPPRFQLCPRHRKGKVIQRVAKPTSPFGGSKSLHYLALQVQRGRVFLCPLLLLGFVGLLAWVQPL
jgi:hypothetical protein